MSNNVGTLFGSDPSSSGGSSFSFVASSQVTTTSGAITTTSFSNFDNSPALAFTPSVTGTYRVYCSLPLLENNINNLFSGRVFKTSGVGTLLYEVQASVYSPGVILASCYVESIYTLTSGVAYVFDIQGMVSAGGSGTNDGTASPFYMFVERVA